VSLITVSGVVAAALFCNIECKSCGSRRGARP
jgi:hypothetical protein